MTTKETEYAVHGVGPVPGTVRYDLPHPVNVLVGRNGAGKTLALEAIRRAAGDSSAAVIKNQDVDAAWVEGPGVVLRTKGHRIIVTGQGSDLAGHGEIHELLDPAGRTPETRNKNRAKALLSFYSEPVDQETVLILVGGDKTAAGGVMGELLRIPMMGSGWALSDAALKAKQILEALARNRESQAMEHKAAADIAKRRIGEIREDLAGAERPDGESAMLAEDLAERQVELGGLDVERRVRVGKEKERERARELQGSERPDSAEAERISLMQSEEVARLRGELIEAKALADQTAQSYLVVLQDARTWDKRQAILDEPIEGPEAKEIETAERELAARTEDLETVKLHEEYDRQYVNRVNAQADQDSEAEKALELRQRVKGVLLEVNVILSRADFGGLILDQDMGLAYVGPETDGEMISFEELSEGQQARAVFLGIGMRYPDKMIPVDRSWFWSLDPLRMRELVKLAIEHGIRFVTELPTSDKGIEVVGLGKEWLAGDTEADAYIKAGGAGEGVA